MSVCGASKRAFSTVKLRSKLLFVNNKSRPSGLSLCNVGNMGRRLVAPCCDGELVFVVGLVTTAGCCSTSDENGGCSAAIAEHDDTLLLPLVEISCDGDCNSSMAFRKKKENKVSNFIVIINSSSIQIIKYKEKKKKRVRKGK